MGNILESFRTHRGLRGLHVFADGKNEKYTGFLPWDKTLLFLRELGDDNIEEQFLDHMTRYNPDTHALAMIQEPEKEQIKLALYSF